MIAGVAQKQPWKQTPNVINFPAHYITFPTSPHYKLSIDLKSREGSPRSLQFLSQLDPGAGAPNTNAAARLQRPGIQIESWHGMARTSNALPMFNMYPYVQLSKHLATIGRNGKCRKSGRSVKIIEPYWTSAIYWRRDNPRSFACGFCLGVKLLLLLLQFMTLLHEAFCSSLKHRRLWKTQRIEYRIEHDRTKMNLSRPMFQCFTKYYKVQFCSCFSDFSVDAKSRRRASCR